MDILIAALGVLFGGAGAFTYQKIKSANAKNNSDKIIAEARKKSAEILERANEKALRITEKANEDESERRKEIRKTENRLAEREESLDRKLDQIDSRNEKLRNDEMEVEKLKNEIKEIRKKQHEKLEKIAKLSKKEAAEKILKLTEKSVTQDMVNLVAKLQKNATEDAEERAQTILVSAMERISSEVTAERTVTALKLPDDEMKGRIIGKEGRNIQALQRETGVDILVDDTPGMVVLSSFDPVRRQIARLALELLMKDGRINPARIEEVVEKAEREINKEINAKGKELQAKVDAADAEAKLQVMTEAKQDFDAFSASKTQELKQYVDQQVNELAKEKKLDVVLLKGAVIGGGVDVTDDLINKMGKASDEDIKAAEAEVNAQDAQQGETQQAQPAEAATAQ